MQPHTSTLELWVDETMVLVTYHVDLLGRVKILGILPAFEETPESDLEWVRGQSERIVRLITKELEADRPEPNFEEI